MNRQAVHGANLSHENPLQDSCQSGLTITGLSPWPAHMRARSPCAREESLTALECPGTHSDPRPPSVSKTTVSETLIWRVKIPGTSRRKTRFRITVARLVMPAAL